MSTLNLRPEIGFLCDPTLNREPFWPNPVLMSPWVERLRDNLCDQAVLSAFSDWLRELEPRFEYLADQFSRCAAHCGQSWAMVWRQGFLPSLNHAHLAALLVALETDSVQLTQGSTTIPPLLMAVQDWPVEAADALGFMGWKGSGLDTIGEVGEFFARLCFEADQRFGEAAACRWFLSWFDDTPRDEMRRELAAECWLGLMMEQYQLSVTVVSKGPSDAAF